MFISHFILPLLATALFVSLEFNSIRKYMHCFDSMKLQMKQLVAKHFLFLLELSPIIAHSKISNIDKTWSYESRGEDDFEMVAPYC